MKNNWKIENKHIWNSINGQIKLLEFNWVFREISYLILEFQLRKKHNRQFYQFAIHFL